MAPAATSSALDRNLARLGTANADLAAVLARTAPRPDLELAESADPVPAGSLGGRALCSRHRPLDEAQRLAGALDLLEHAVVVVMGFGLGYHVQELARRARRATVIVIFEPDLGLLRAVLERIDHSEWLGTAPIVWIHDAADRGTMSGKLSGAEALIAQGVTFLEHPSSRWRLGEDATRFTAAFADLVNTVRTTMMTTLLRSVETVRNLLLNIDHYAAGPGAAELRGAAAGRLAVVVSAGPSLARNIHLLAEPGVSQRCVIIAVQTTLKPLLAAGVKPHFVTALDYHEISRRFYEELGDHDLSDVTLLADPKAHPLILDSFPGPVRCCQSPFLDQVLGDLRRDMGTLPAGATVAHLAVYLARHLGCDPIAMIGQDLCFTDGLYYGPGTAIEAVWAPELNPFNTIEMMQWQRIARHRLHLQRRTDIHGRTVYSDVQMLAYLQQFERDFAELARAGARLIDATEGGLPKANTITATLEETLRRYGGSGPAGPAPPAPGLDPQRLRAAAERVAEVRREVTLVHGAAQRTRGLIGDLLACLGRDQARARNLLHAIDGERALVAGHMGALELLNALNQLGTFKRFRADRRLHLRDDGESAAAQRARLERDLENVAWLADAAPEMIDQLAAAEKLLKGEKVDHRPSSAPRAALSSPVEIAAPPGRIAALVPIDPDRSGLGVRRSLAEPLDGRSVLQITLERLGRCRHIESIVLLVPRSFDVAPLIERRSIGLTVEIAAVDGSPFPPEQPAIAAARAWACRSWRGGIAGMSIYDEALCPQAMHKVMQERDLSAALVVAPDWVLIDPALCDAVVARHREHPQQHALVFTQAPPGLAGCVVARGLMTELANRNRRATIGALLVHQPHAPQGDPIARDANVQIDHEVRSALLRLTADLPRGRDLVARMLAQDPELRDRGAAAIVDRASRALERCVARVPEHVILEITTRRHSRGRFEASRRPPGGAARGDMPLNLIEHLLDELGRAGDVLLTLDGAGDPLEHPEIERILELARRSGIDHVHVRSELRCGPHLLHLLAGGTVDVVSVDLHADRAATYETMMGEDAFKATLVNMQSLLERRTPLTPQPPASAMAVPWVVPRLRRCAETLDDIDSFFDRWVHQLGTCVIEGEPLAGGAAPDLAPVHVPQRVVSAELERRMTILSDGSVPVSELDRGGRDTIGTIASAPLAELWPALLEARRRRPEACTGLWTP